MSIKDLSRATQRRIVEERTHRPFRDFDDFTGRVKPEEQEIRALINAGAFGSLAEDRDQAALFWQLARRKQAAAGAGSMAPTLFAAPSPTAPPRLPRGREIDRLRRQFRTPGLSDRPPPDDPVRRSLGGQSLIKAADLPSRVGRRVGLAGWLITYKTVRSKHDQPMQFTPLRTKPAWSRRPSSDVFKRCHLSLEQGRPYILHGLVEENYGVLTLTVDKILPITM